MATLTHLNILPLTQSMQSQQVQSNDTITSSSSHTITSTATDPASSSSSATKDAQLPLADILRHTLLRVTSGTLLPVIVKAHTKREQSALTDRERSAVTDRDPASTAAKLCWQLLHVLLGSGSAIASAVSGNVSREKTGSAASVDVAAKTPVDALTNNIRATAVSPRDTTTDDAWKYDFTLFRHHFCVWFAQLLTQQPDNVDKDTHTTGIINTVHTAIAILDSFLRVLMPLITVGARYITDRVHQRQRQLKRARVDANAVEKQGKRQRLGISDVLTRSEDETRDDDADEADGDSSSASDADKNVGDQASGIDGSSESDDADGDDQLMWFMDSEDETGEQKRPDD